MPDPTRHLSLLERIAHLRERAGWNVKDAVWSARSDGDDWVKYDQKNAAAYKKSIISLNEDSLRNNASS